MRRAPVLAVLALLAAPLAAREVPYLAGRVNDEAEMLSPAAEERMDAALEALERDTGAQVAVLTIAALDGEPLEDYSLEVASTWKLGRGEFDDGALLLIVRDERKMRLEVGYGLEPVLTDARSRRILDDVLRPRFRGGDFDGGVEEAVTKIADLLRGEDTLPPPAESRERGRSGGSSGMLILMLLFFSFGAILTPGARGWVQTVLMMIFWLVMLPGLVLGRWGWWPVVILLLFFPLVRLLFQRTAVGRAIGKRLARSSRSRGWISGGGGSGGGYSGGGFSGGGGSFGGGGASSSW